ncbi:hypothetical protein CP10743SC13_0538 [Chlamydia psittaci 10_743_SC13]|nr:hypothetical protein CP10743SC13_0538 [Chlamydia psittaci 10_743_SC13]
MLFVLTFRVLYFLHVENKFFGFSLFFLLGVLHILLFFLKLL